MDISIYIPNDIFENIFERLPIMALYNCAYINNNFHTIIFGKNFQYKWRQYKNIFYILNCFYDKKINCINLKWTRSQIKLNLYLMIM